MAKPSTRRGAVKGNGLFSNNHNGLNGNGGRPRGKTGRALLRNSGRPRIAVFGSSRAVRGDPLFNQSLKMGRALGAAGYDVMTGGYMGVMEAVSQGAYDAGAHVLGITMKGFEDRANPYVMDEIFTPNFYVRFRWLIDRADGFIAMRGGMGTLAEMTFAWQKLSLRMFTERPLILVGREWQAILEVWADTMTVIPDDYHGLTVAPTPEKAVQTLDAFFKPDGQDLPRKPVVQPRPSATSG
jgi:uncharacterized protein (TIGR00730 family)